MRNRNKFLCFLLVFLMCFSFSLTAMASEDTVDQNQDQASEVTKDSSRGLLESMLRVIFKNPTTNGVAEDENDVGSIMQPFKMLNESVVIIYRALEGIYGSSLYTAFIAIGVVLLTIYFLMDLSTRDILDNTGNRDTIEQIAKPFIKWVLCIIFIMNVKWILLMLLGMSQVAYNQIPETLTISFSDVDSFSSPDNVSEIDTQGVIDQIYEMIGYKEGGGIMKFMWNSGIQIPLLMAFLIPWLVSLVCEGLLIYVILSRIVSIAIQGAMAPIAMADAYSSNGNASIRDTRAWSYIKNFASLCFQSVVISLTLLIVNTIIMVFISRIFGAINTAGSWATIGWWLNIAVQMTILKMVQVGTVMGSAQKAKELFNA